MASKDEIKAEVLNLSASILLGEVDKSEIERVSKLAIDSNLSDFLRDEFRSISKTITRT